LIVCCRENLERHVVALSFDDGPALWTPAILDLLAEYGARATFFVVGRYVDERPDLVARAAREGHELGNHTYDHVDPGHERDDDTLRDQIRWTSAAIERAAGAPPRLMRPPYGKDVCRVARLAREAGMAHTVLWSAQGWDWEELPAAQITASILRGRSPGGILLLHDGAPPNDTRSRDATVVALGAILVGLRADGYDVVTVSELLAA
jgi:peptidoglycan/xylan/chitin deacetylase (PgdA/CDA1 family)